MPTLLAIESSCDDTGASIIRNGKILTNIISSQDIHKKYGGVVPELASRAHQRNIVPIIQLALKEAGITKNDLDAIAYTQGPGLLGALLVGASFAKGLALSLELPLIEVNHIHAHILSHFIDDPKPEFPFLCLLVSGGHTQIFVLHDYLTFEIIGKTIDDAAGEALDKAAKVLDLPYPGGPEIDKLAKSGNPHAFQFPKPGTGGLDFSFSGLKTSLLYFLRDELKNDPQFIQNNLHDICASYQYRIVTYLIEKLRHAAKETGIKNIGIAGGVAANSLLRKHLHNESKEKGWQVFIPELQYCTDNAAMIAEVAYHKYKNGSFASLESKPFAR